MLLSKIEDLVLKHGYWYSPSRDVFLHREIYYRVYDEPADWFVHHIDGNKLNNHLSNLIAMPEALHGTICQMKPLPDHDTIVMLLENGQATANRMLANQKAAAAKKRRKERNKTELRTEIARFHAGRNRLQPFVGIDKKELRQKIDDWVKANPGKVRRIAPR